MDYEAPELPSSAALSQLGVVELEELRVGKQSRVLTARRGGDRVVVKLIDRRLADPTAVRTRLAVVELLAKRTELVVPAIRIDGDVIVEVDGWLVALMPFIDGRLLDVTDPDDGYLMGETLVALHSEMESLPPIDLPPAAALREVMADRDRTGWQLLHGDFSHQNLVTTERGLRLLDFDDCGYGPVEFDVANSLYMVLFDAFRSGDHQRFHTYRAPFCAGYRDAGRTLESPAIDVMIALRVDALRRWIDAPDRAPIGIRTSSSEWHATLRSFTEWFESSEAVQLRRW